MPTDPSTEQDAKAKIGYFGSHVPRELTYALDRIPVRIRPTAHKVSEAGAFLPRDFRSLVKITLASFLEGDSDLEGVIPSDSCDALQRLNDIWRHYVDAEALRLLGLPGNDTTVSREYFRHSLHRLSRALEERLDSQLTTDRLASSTRCYGEQRSLMGDAQRQPPDQQWPRRGH
jgi:benzoyl-CoA reductase/2-hydroxyglutaryl-CoA dehydratase subunit BcrC/BadD/HgdB